MIIINGVRYDNVSGGNISIHNGSLIVDGKHIDGQLQGVVRIEVEGSLISLTTDAAVNVKGDVNGNVVAGGSVNCNGVTGSVQAGGSVNCNGIGGSVTAGGSVSY